MKFKYLIIAFILFMVIIIAATAMAPLFLINSPEQAASFKFVSLPLLIVMGIILLGMIIFFSVNYRLFSLLEREDWPALSYYLEQIVYGKGKYNYRRIRLLASSYLVITDYASVIKLESKTMHVNPSIVEKNALIFGAARVLSGDTKGSAAFFNTYMEKGNKQNRQWMHWFYGFSALINSDFTTAEKEFIILAASSNDGLITGLSSYFLQSSVSKYSLNSDKCLAAAEDGRSRVLKALKTIGNWKKEADRMSTEIHIAIVRKYIDEAGLWIYSPGN